MRNTHRPNNDILYNATKYNLCCAGINCINTPKYLLRFLWIERSGWFCENCKQFLQKVGLVESIICENISVNEGGEE
jgi:hypothetical protein